jgi:hypothetical protein
MKWRRRIAPETLDHARFGLQLTRLNHEIETSDTGSAVNLDCDNFPLHISVQGHPRPRRSNAHVHALPLGSESGRKFNPMMPVARCCDPQTVIPRSQALAHAARHVNALYQAFMARKFLRAALAG